MAKKVQIKFSDNDTIEEIISRFNNLISVEMEPYIVIDGTRINFDDESRDDKIISLYNKHHGIDEGLEELNSKLHDIYSVLQDIPFKFMLGIVLKYTKPEYVATVRDNYIYLYSSSGKKQSRDTSARNLNYMAELILILNNNMSDVEKGLRILEIINRIDDESEQLRFSLAVKNIRDYIIGGERINELLCLDLLEETLAKTHEAIQMRKKKNNN